MWPHCSFDKCVIFIFLFFFCSEFIIISLSDGNWNLMFVCYQTSPAYLVLWLAPRQTRYTSSGGRSIHGFTLETLIVWCVWFEHAKQFWCFLWNVLKKKDREEKKNTNQSKSNPIALGRKLISFSVKAAGRLLRSDLFHSPSLSCLRSLTHSPSVFRLLLN